MMMVVTVMGPSDADSKIVLVISIELHNSAIG